MIYDDILTNKQKLFYKKCILKNGFLKLKRSTCKITVATMSIIGDFILLENEWWISYDCKGLIYCWWISGPYLLTIDCEWDFYFYLGWWSAFQHSNFAFFESINVQTAVADQCIMQSLPIFIFKTFWNPYSQWWCFAIRKSV